MQGAQEDQQMNELRRNLEKEVNTDRFKAETEELLKGLLEAEKKWESDIKQKCLLKIQEQKELNDVDINKMSEDLLNDGIANIPKDIE